MSDGRQRYARELAVALAAVREAAVLTRAVQAEITPAVLEKKDKSPVTVADWGSQALICRALAAAFPKDPIIGEESSGELRADGGRVLRERLVEQVGRLRPGATGDEILGWIDLGGGVDGAPRFWTLDPIDGTKGFLRKEQYAISLALVVDGRVALGVLGCPNLSSEEAGAGPGLLSHAVRGGGAFAEPMDGGQAWSIRVSERTEPSAIRFCESVEAAHSSHSDSARVAERLAIAAEPVRLDSQAKYAEVARGRAEAYLRLPRNAEYREKIWDHAGGVVVVEEAGGRVTDVQGRPLDFSRGRTLAGNLGVVVSNGRVHDALLRAVDELGIGRFR
ncbi:MAG TPA: 3'(2'),5'-bisphosphate nucleotidase [Polyangia bacterium]|nr:3'(2'),5'-bisphosphate nucleotidase [Polyangia bacterium]